MGLARRGRAGLSMRGGSFGLRRRILRPGGGTSRMQGSFGGRVCWLVVGRRCALALGGWSEVILEKVRW
jgi:hypothetical protein